MKRKVCVVVTARPSYSRVKTALDAISVHPDLELQLVVAASALLERYGRVEEQILADGFQIDARVYMVLEGENPASMAKTTGLGVLELATVFDNLRPDIVVTIADRFETLATATAAVYMGIPLAHVQGGEITGSIDERVRHAVTKLADIHFPSTEGAGSNIIRMGEPPERVHVVGCPSIDLAAQVPRNTDLSFDPFTIYGGVGETLDLADGFIVVMQHPVTTEHRESREQVQRVLAAVDASGVNALWFWPNVDAGADGTSKGIRNFRENRRDTRIHFFKNMAPAHFIELLRHSRGIVGNSSVAIRECAFLGVPAVNIGTRQSGRERGLNVIDVDCDEGAIGAAIDKQISRGIFESDPIYGAGHAGERIADHLALVSLSIEKQLTY
jgi:UDP-hydrolysing UDP-N-acetyl-D-glucosamine 2-epimerase